MDRNDTVQIVIIIVNVALRKESVDRNIIVSAVLLMYNWSLSARRAWIEITPTSTVSWMDTVALRKESVDRNWSAYPKKTGKAESLSARRAWIEIALARGYVRVGHGRSPQGERG